MKTATAKLSPQILEEASRWFVELNEADTDTTTRSEFDTWLRRSPEHVQAYLQISALWENAGALTKGNALASEELVARARADSNVIPLGEVMIPAQVEKPSAQALDLRPQYSGPRLQTWVAIAATLLLTVGGSLLTWHQYFRGVYTTDIGEQRSLALEDGTTIELNSRSELRVRYDDDRRSVELRQGQALFHVAHDPARPFIVESNGTEVRAVGTQFDVYRKTTGTIVTVLEGKVAVSAPNSPLGVRGEAGKSEVALIAGEQLTVPADIPALSTEHSESAAATPTPAVADVDAATAWTRRQLVFQATPLSEVIEEFNRYNSRPMVIVDESLEATRISGIFSSTDPNPLLTFLQDLANCRVEETPEQIRISRR